MRGYIQSMSDKCHNVFNINIHRKRGFPDVTNINHPMPLMCERFDSNTLRMFLTNAQPLIYSSINLIVFIKK